MDRIIVVYGAGSTGKTTVIINRIKYTLTFISIIII